MKKSSFWVLVVVTVLFLSSTIFANSQITFDDLDKMSNSQKLQYLIDEGLVLSDFYRNHLDYTEDLISRLIGYIEKGTIQQNRIPYNYDKLVDLTQQLLNILKQVRFGEERFAKSSYRLRDSTPLGNWRDSYRDYNCYAYSLNRRQWLLVGDYSNRSWNPYMTIDETADIIIEDLKNMGFTSYKTSRLGNSIYERAELIAIRTGKDDYHFMKDVYNERDWEHKPGGYQPMSWNYRRPDYKIWSNECVDEYGSYEPTTFYDSDVIYIYYWPEDEGPRPYMIKKLIKE